MKKRRNRGHLGSGRFGKQVCYFYPYNVADFANYLFGADDRVNGPRSGSGKWKVRKEIDDPSHLGIGGFIENVCSFFLASQYHF